MNIFTWFFFLIFFQIIWFILNLHDEYILKLFENMYTPRLPHIAKLPHTTAHYRAQCWTSAHCRTHCRTAAHSCAHCCTLSHCSTLHELKCRTPHTAHRTQSHIPQLTWIHMILFKCICIYIDLCECMWMYANLNSIKTFLFEFKWINMNIRMTFLVLFQIIWSIPKFIRIYMDIFELIWKYAHSVHCCNTLCTTATLPHTAARTAKQCHAHCHTLPRALPHTATCTTTHSRAHSRAHCRAHCLTAEQPRTAASNATTAAHTMRDTAWIERPHTAHHTLHTAHRTQSHTAFNMNWYYFIWMDMHKHGLMCFYVSSCDFIWI
jgi:hypothetical protein